MKPLSLKGSGRLLDPDRHLTLVQSSRPAMGRGQEPAAQRAKFSYAAAPAGSLHYAGGPGTLSQPREDSACDDGPSSPPTALLTKLTEVGLGASSRHRPSVLVIVAFWFLLTAAFLISSDQTSQRPQIPDWKLVGGTGEMEMEGLEPEISVG